MSQWIRPKRSGALPNFSSRRPISATARPKSSAFAASIPMPSPQRPQCGRSPRLVSKSQVRRSKLSGRCQPSECLCMRAVTSPSTPNFSTRWSVDDGSRPALPLEQHDIARTRHRRVPDLLDQLAVATRYRNRGDHHAVAAAAPAARRAPRRWRSSSGSPRDARAARIRRSVGDHLVGGVLREIDELRRLSGLDPVAIERRGGELAEAFELPLMRKIVELHSPGQ